jgi:signal transduction histidine kinase
MSNLHAPHPAATPSAATADDNAWRLLAEAELFHVHFARWRVAIAGAITLCAVVCGLFFYLTRDPSLWWWFVLQTGAYALQGIFCLRYERHPPAPGSREFTAWMWIWTLQTALAGLISGALIFWIPTDQLGLLLAAIMISGTFAIGEASAGGHEKLVFAAVLSQAAMTCIALVAHAGLPLGVIVCALFASVVLHFGRELNRALLGAIEQRLRAQQLASALQLGQQRLLEAQHQQSVLQERQRVMQDMHDGLGSALSSSLVLIERGALDVSQTAAVLRECIDDLRLVVDSLEPTSKDLSTLLGMLRYRLQHRIEAAGVQLRWQMDDLPALDWLEPSLALDLLRVTQEAIANALKHAAAAELALTVRHAGDYIELSLRDDGRGFDRAAAAAAGRGLRGMRMRAQRLHAQLTIDSSPGGGTTVRLCLPIVIANEIVAETVVAETIAAETVAAEAFVAEELLRN